MTAENKINILGEFNLIRASEFPVTLPSLTLVIRLEAGGHEAADHTLHVRLLDDDGNLVRPIMDGRFRLSDSGYEGVARRIQGVFPIALATFERAGTYVFDVLVDNERPEVASPIEVHVVHVPPA